MSTGFRRAIVRAGAIAMTLIATRAFAADPPPPAIAYAIDARLNPIDHTLTAVERVSWRNDTATPVAELPFLLSLNRWRTVPPPGHGSIAITGIRMRDAAGEALPGWRLVSPAAGDDDQTQLAVALPSAVPPGGSVRLEIAWRVEIARAIDGIGYIRDFTLLARWYPQLALGDSFASFDVRLTVPAGWIVGATGVPQSQAANADRSVTYRFAQDLATDFAWASSPHFQIRRERIEPGVEIELLLQPEHASQAERHIAAARTAMQRFTEWFGPPPYQRLTIVDPPWQSGADGLSFPMLITTRTRWIQLASDLAPEATIAEGVAMQYWAASIAPAGADQAWLAQGLSRYSASRLMPELFARVSRVPGTGFAGGRWFGGFIPYLVKRVPRGIDGDFAARASYRAAPATRSASKAELALDTLERYLGWPTLQRVLQAYAERFHLGHPTADDFFAVAGDVSGRDLSWFFDQVYRSGDAFDYGIDRLDSRRASGVGEPSVYRTSVVVRRYGGATFSGTSRAPVGPFESGDAMETAVTFADGGRIETRWDGRERRKTFVFESTAPAVAAEVDPRHVLALDVNRTNNSRTLTPASDRAARKWASLWITWMQDCLLSVAALV